MKVVTAKGRKLESSRGHISVNELLEMQSKQSLKFVVQEIANLRDSVRLTPYVSGIGELRNLSMKIPRSAIGGLHPTGETTASRGRDLRVVEITFQSGANIMLEDIYSQLLINAMQLVLPDVMASYTLSWNSPASGSGNGIVTVKGINFYPGSTIYYGYWVNGVSNANNYSVVTNSAGEFIATIQVPCSATFGIEVSDDTRFFDQIQTLQTTCK